MKRQELTKQLKETSLFDFIIIGGGATGLGIAVDAASRGYKVALFEKADFAKGTSSKSTKLLHGGVRYLANGDVSLVLEALKERGLAIKNAPHLSKSQEFIIANYSIFDNLQYTVGLTLYDLLAGRLSLGGSRYLKKSTVLKKLPTIRTEGLKGGVLYTDGQFDDSRMAINLAQTAKENGAVILNYFNVLSLSKDSSGKISGVEVKDTISNEAFSVNSKVVINATGVFVDDIIKLADKEALPTVRPSQGTHIVLDQSFLQSDKAIMIPKTSDGRVLFAIPWHGKVVVGTTDKLVDSPSLDPIPMDAEVDFILETAAAHLTKKPTRADVLSVFAGLRPLAAALGGNKNTKSISRSHVIHKTDSDLITITGGKWTTYRRMALDLIKYAIKHNKVESLPCKTENLKIHGYSTTTTQFNNPRGFYGSDLTKIEDLENTRPELNELLHKNYSFKLSEIVWSVQNEMALNVEDFLARRIRILFLDAKAAKSLAPKVAEVMAKELNESTEWITSQVESFNTLADQYILK